ncbi:MAG: DUF503 domain-containing protein [Chloroflexi bacterium]|nr:DUF503 domain-containing protein [Chloroflexota bacterium]
MHVGAARITIHLPASRSLKDKRSTVRAMVNKLQQAHYAAAEVDTLDQWQLITLGITTVTNDGAQAHRLLASAVALIEAHLTEGLVTDVQTEVLTMLT